MTSELATPPAAHLTGPIGSAWLDRYGAAVMNTFGRPQRVLVRGEGCYVWDADGNRYLDLFAGIAVNVLGHAHPFLVSAITAQLATLGHVSNLFTTTPQVVLAERLLEQLGAPDGSRVFLTNSGTEAIEGCFKLARRTGRIGMVAAENAFHGRSMGALALTHKASYREPFEPLPPGVVHVPYGDVGALRAALTAGPQPVAAVVLEPIQGEGGVIPAPPGYLAAARQLCDEAGALLILDEIQTGVGRTGAWFGHQLPQLGGGIRPDVVALAKGLGGGIPIGAFIALGPAAQLLGPGQHGTTFGGNPVAAAAALATLHVIERDGLLERAAALGARLSDGVTALGHPLVAGVRGHGLLLGVELARPVAAEVATALLEAGYLVNAVRPGTLRLAPALVLSTDQADAFLSALPAALEAARPAAEVTP